MDVDIRVVDSKPMYEEALRSFFPDLVICDHSLPSFSSLEAFDMLHESPNKIPFILVTGTVSEEFAVEAMRHGADDYLLKDRRTDFRLQLQVPSTIQRRKIIKSRNTSVTSIKILSMYFA